MRYRLRRTLLPWTIPGDLSVVVKRYIEPHVTPQSVVLEIGPGGGRWTQYMLNAKEVVIVDLNPEFFDYLKDRFKEDPCQFRFYRTSGFELVGIASDSVDFIFTFGTFVHIDPSGIDAYLGHIKRVLKPGALAVIQYADKRKTVARLNPGFSSMDQAKMENLVFRHGLRMLEHNLTLLNHSNIVKIQK